MQTDRQTDRQTWCNCCRTKLVHCWMIFLRSAWHLRSLITRPSASASRRVRKVRRKLLAWQFSPRHWSNILNKKFSSQERQNSREHMWFLSEQRTGSRKYKTCKYISLKQNSIPQWNTNLQHGITVSIRDVYLQAWKACLVVVLKIKSFNTQLWINNLHTSVRLGNHWQWVVH